MNYLLMTLLAISVIIAVAILIIFIGVLGVWMKGADALAFPGLGLLVSTPLILVMLLVSEIVMVLLSAYLVRYIPIMQLMFGEIDEL
jgi:hypothetical protein